MSNGRGHNGSANNDPAAGPPPPLPPQPPPPPQPPQPPRRRSSHRITTTIDTNSDEEDVVSMLERDASAFSVVSRNSDLELETSSAEFSYSRNADDDSDDNDMGQSARTHQSAVSSASRQKADLQDTTKGVTDDIDMRRKNMIMLLGLAACLIVVSLGAVSAGLQKERDANDENKDTWSNNNLEKTLVDANDNRRAQLENSIESFAAVMTQQAAGNSSDLGPWPLVTNRLFEVQGQYTRKLAEVEFLGFSPLVESTQQMKESWESYALEHQNWIDENWKILEDTNNSINPSGSIATTIYHHDNSEGYPVDPMQYAPLWQTSPPPAQATIINQDMFSYTNLLAMYEDMMTESEGKYVHSAVMPDLPDIYGFDFTLEHSDKVSIPRSLMMIPVRNSLVDNENTTVVGLLQVAINWDTYLRAIIPKNTTGTALLHNNCGQHYAFSLSEEADLALLDTNAVQQTQNTIVLEEVLSQGGNGKDSCSYTIELDLLESGAVGNGNENNVDGLLMLTLVPLVIATLLLALMAVQLYHFQRLVQNRHEDMVKSAAKSSAIVASMFPSKVRDRLYADVEHDFDESDHKQKSGKKKKQKRKSGVFAAENSESKNKDTNMDGSLQDGAPAGMECFPGRFQRAGSERLRNYLDGGLTAFEAKNSEPIADLFPHCTVLFADIAGFTAWSSVREPRSVFTLLETLYCAFDDIAKRRNVFKVETVGDCYVAVTGLPEPQDDHALIMVRFARDCMYKSYELTKKLEVTLGPDTAELSMRFGLHSGPVTAGVLRGDRARFQLFGDTVNTASRMESTGQKGRIQMSQETADLLMMIGKAHLVRQREDKIVAKGKGELTSFWVALGADRDENLGDGDVPAPTTLSRNVSGVDSIAEGVHENDSDNEGEEGAHNNSSDAITGNMNLGRKAPTRRKPPAVSMSMYAGGMSQRQKKRKKQSRLVDWTVEVLSKLLKHVISRRQALGLDPAPEEEVRLDRPEGQTVLEEVQEIITLPMFDASAAKKQEDPEKVELDSEVREQLHEYVSTLFSMYRDNPFHNAEHASHVTMSVIKLLARIVAPGRREWKTMTSDDTVAAELHDHTYGITSDPLTQFSVVLSALIHDVDHTGVPNAQLVQENSNVAELYKGKSVAEQNSVDQSWDLLLEPQFKELRNEIYCNDAELTRFRSLLVNSVMATDIVDKELKNLRNARWDRAFRKGDYTDHVDTNERDAVNRKATIVIEHLIQASDVSHTMQHWHVYRKWNERLFHEMYNAFRHGRAEKDPSEFWYKGEIGFFDFYIIPLAKKLKDCGVFGSCGEEYLNYALKNREEWQQKGEAVTAEMVAKARDQDLARMEKQASMRGPVIAEMKQAVRTLRLPQSKTDMYRQASFRHLRVEPEVAESVSPPQRGFRRQPPTRGRGTPTHAVSIGTAERETMKQFRRLHPTGSSHGPRRGPTHQTEKETPQPSAEPTPEEVDPPTTGMGMRKPQRQASLAFR